MSIPMSDLKAFDTWYEKSGVRVTLRRMLSEDDEDILKDFFPRHLVPHLNHPLVREQEEPLQRYLSAQHLYQWLNFTSHFEVAVVCRATQQIAEDNCGLEISNRARMDAFKILIDEGYHSLYSLDVADQIEKRSGIKALAYDFQHFLGNLDAIGDDYPQHKRLVQLLQVVVFETLITSILADIPADKNVISVIRETVRDHAIDEGRHHAYFSAFFTQLWGQLDRTERQLVAKLLPDVIVRSLQPATKPAEAALNQAGLKPEIRRSVIAESYSRDAVLGSIRFASAKTVALFEQTGVLEMPGARDGFFSAGLLVE
ncbi:diiron oxygenase [Streptomyces sp. NPDC050704]|uniref:diiron oxygenase n=1 Tax=Streptomyces sp. NPDC050704 TaxID=3157219 RepID=UPI00341F23C3